MTNVWQVMRTGLAGAVLALLALPMAVEAQAGGPSARCAGTWASSCASVDVSADGDRLFFYVPNAAPESGVRAERDGQRVRVYRDRPGMACDPATGHGCVDVTEEWSGPEDPEEDERCTAREEESDSTAPAAEESAEESASNGDAGDEACAAVVAGDSDSEARRAERRRAGAVAFAVAVPATAFLWLDGGSGSVVRSASGVGDGGEDGDGEAGNQDSDSGATGDGDGGNDETDGDTGNGDTGNGNAGNGNTGNGNTGNGNAGTGDTGDGNTGSGDTGGGDTGNGETLGEGPWPAGDEAQPPMSEVPEPVSTTLVGLGLLGYAGSRIRRRLQDDEEADAIG